MRRPSTNPVTVTAKGNVLVSALHDATGYVIAGAVAIGGTGAGAGALSRSRCRATSRRR